MKKLIIALLIYSTSAYALTVVKVKGPESTPIKPITGEGYRSESEPEQKNPEEILTEKEQQKESQGSELFKQTEETQPESQQQAPLAPSFGMPSTTEPSFSGNVSEKDVTATIIPEREISASSQTAPKTYRSSVYQVARARTQLGQAVDSIISTFKKGSIGINDAVRQIKDSFTASFKQGAKRFSSQINDALQQMPSNIVQALERSNSQDLQESQRAQKENQIQQQDIARKQDDLSAEKQRLQLQATYQKPSWKPIGVSESELQTEEMQQRIAKVDSYMNDLEELAKQIKNAAMEEDEKIQETTIIGKAIKRLSGSNKGTPLTIQRNN